MISLPDYESALQSGLRYSGAQTSSHLLNETHRKSKGKKSMDNPQPLTNQGERGHLQWVSMTEGQDTPTPGPRSQPGLHYHETGLRSTAPVPGTSGGTQLQMWPGLSGNRWVPSTVFQLLVSTASQDNIWSLRTRMQVKHFNTNHFNQSKAIGFR